MYPGWKQIWKDEEVTGWEFEKDPSWYLKRAEYDRETTDGNTNAWVVWTIGFLVDTVRIEITFGGPVTDKKSAKKYQDFVIGAMKIVTQGGDVYEVFGKIVKLAGEMEIWISKIPPNPSEIPDVFAPQRPNTE